MTARQAADAEEVDQIITRAGALAAPARVEIVLLLLDSPQPQRQIDITPRVSLTQPTVAHHLRLLRAAELITSRKEGIHVYYTATDKAERALRGLGNQPPPRNRTGG